MEIKTGTGLTVLIQEGISRKNEKELSVAILEQVCADIQKDVPYGQGVHSIMHHTKDFGYIIGANKYVQRIPNEEILWKRLPGEKEALPFVARNPELTSKATVVLMRINANQYLLLSSNFGPYHPCYPHRYTDMVEKQNAILQWEHLAIAEGIVEQA